MQLLLQALHGSLLEVVAVFEDCARYGLLRSMITAGELYLLVAACQNGTSNPLTARSARTAQRGSRPVLVPHHGSRFWEVE